MFTHDHRIVSMSLPSAAQALGAPAVPVHPALQRRTALRDRRPIAVRRHTGRVATRFAVLLAGDIVGVLLAQAAAMYLAAETEFGRVALGGTPLLLGETRFLFFSILVLVSVFATGGHS